MIDSRIIGAVGGVAPTMAIGALLLMSDTTNGLVTLLGMVGSIAAVAGAIAAPVALRPRRRPIRASFAYAMSVLGLWLIVGLCEVIVTATSGTDQVVGAIAMRVIVWVAYAGFALLPLWLLGTLWVVATWFVDGLAGGPGERHGTEVTLA